MSIEAGFGKVDMTVFEPGMAMLGWGVEDDIPVRARHPLHARALVLRESGRRFAYVVADLCFIAAGLRVAVLEELQRRGLPFHPADVVLTATHTHAGPNGFSHAFFYDLSALGFSRLVFGRLVRSITDAIEAALDRLVPARLSLGAAPVRGPVVRNRSLDAHRRNPDAMAEGIDRELLALRVDDLRGHPLGVVSWFALHATSIHAGSGALHPDHKGLAAASLEAKHEPGFVALFAQGAAGDVSPNVRYDRTRGLMVGPASTDEQSAHRVAQAQVQATEHACRQAQALEGPLDARCVHLDMEERYVPPEFAGGRPARTTRGLLGLAMARGTAEGPGPLAGARLPTRFWSDDPKVTLLAIGPHVRRRLLGFDPARLPVPHAAFAHAARSGGLQQPWIPTVLPLQVLRIGEFVLAALPNEPTTIVGVRLRTRLEAELRVRRVYVQGYANAYTGYVTTPEEYRAQRYEGAYTLFGPHTAGALTDALCRLGRSLDRTPAPIAGPPLPRCRESELRSRAFVASARSTTRRARA